MIHVWIETTSFVYYTIIGEDLINKETGIFTVKFIKNYVHCSDIISISNFVIQTFKVSFSDLD